ncbi:MAG: hypothetical protein IPG99_15105 [Ignavibacteria bacterium]|nr:hypothetical protein [Ignavibacteria bacterium]
MIVKLTKRLFCLMIISILCVSCSSSERMITIDYDVVEGNFKDLSGMNGGPGKSLAGYQDVGVKTIRTHDYYGPFDYWHYTTF